MFESLYHIWISALPVGKKLGEAQEEPEKITYQTRHQPLASRLISGRSITLVLRKVALLPNGAVLT